MGKKKINLIIIVCSILLLVFLLKDIFSQSTVDDLKGGFTEIATYRNENNTGPVQRIYAVSVKDSATAELAAYGSLMPHNKYGNTKVYFFKEGVDIPQKLYPGNQNFEVMYQQNCFALYEKSAMGNFGLILNPFKN